MTLESIKLGQTKIVIPPDFDTSKSKVVCVCVCVHVGRQETEEEKRGRKLIKTNKKKNKAVDRRRKIRKGNKSEKMGGYSFSYQISSNPLSFY